MEADNSDLLASLRRINNYKICLKLENACPIFNRLLIVRGRTNEEEDVNEEEQENQAIRWKLVKRCDSQERSFTIRLQPGTCWTAHLFIEYKWVIFEPKIPGVNGDTIMLMMADWSSNSVASTPTDYQYLPFETLHMLYNSAKDFCRRKSGDSFLQIDYFSRCQPNDNWNAATKEQGILFLETSIRTAHDGHASKLNYSYGGIYFFARPIPLGMSFFGDREMLLNKRFRVNGNLIYRTLD